MTETIRRSWPTVPEIADDIRTSLAAGDTAHAMRMLADGINRLPAAHTAGRLDETLTRPDSVGDHRWDALLYGAIRYRLHQMGKEPPSWTWLEPLPQFWWPAAYSPEKAYNDMARTPAELMRLGIFLDENEFSTA